ncbi:NlpC/P60 family protein [Nocardia shimofusensis]|uniref:NlpC/P60 family protein n=1 Tax=Nocardia shimofusensis TaxID=228596 RepID=UPI000830F188|nr:NlpC/P60 family protein [Nocardia shimofusensis]
MRRSHGAGQRSRWLIALGLLVCAALVLTAGAGVAVPPPPPNPSDGQIAQAGAQVDAGVGAVGTLINEVAAVDQQLRQLDDEVATRREEVNKALVDLHLAREAADAAAAHVAATQADLSVAGAEVARARHGFDDFATAAYTRPTSGSLITHLTAATPTGAIDRAEVIGLVSKNQQQVLDTLRRAQIELGNRNSEAREAKSQADTAAAEAEHLKVAAENAVAAATSALAGETARRDGLLRERDAAQARLDAARATVQGLHTQREVYQDWNRQRLAEEAQALLTAAAEAAARAAADLAARERAAQLGEGKRPHTELENTPAPKKKAKPSPSSPSVRGSQAVEIVVDRAMSQLGVTYAWGGGDEDGPTLGIRDGGVADSYGDYNKVGFDCSGLMLYAFAGIGVSLPHYSGYQYNAGTRVPLSEKARGDMLFWGPGGSQHVALYLGNGKMVEAPQSGDVVKVSPVREDGIMPYAVRIIS